MRATFRFYWPGKAFWISSPPISFEEYPTADFPLEHLIHRLVGEVHRMIEYPRRGYQAPDEVPEEVLSAWSDLIERGFRRSLV